jgi:serine/threonine protein phosphatase PrpC
MAEHLFGLTDAGKVRDNNEDVFIALEVMNGNYMVAAVIDGVGGYEGGEIAAAITKEVVLDELSAIGADVVSQLNLAFNIANEEVIARKLGDKNLADMACVATLTVIDKAQNLLHYIHVGDTRLYLFRDNTLIKISKDQSFVGFLEDSGRITEEAAMQHPKRNQINQALGLESHDEMTESYYELGTSPFLPGDLILICSDGLTDMVDAAAISAILNHTGTLDTKAKQLIDAANAAGGKDNVTVVLARNDKAPVAQEPSRPVPTAVKPVPTTVTLGPTATKAGPQATDKRQQPPQPVQQLQADLQAPATVETVAPLKVYDDHLKTPAFVAPTGKQPKALLIILSLLCLLFLGSTIWLFVNSAPVALKPAAGLAPPASLEVLNPQEKLLTDALAALKSDTLLLSDEVYKSPIILSRALNINRATLIIKTKGNVVLQRDTAYTGAAMVLSSVCEQVKIDQLVLTNFEVGIVSYQNVLDLSNVRFNNCKVPLQVLFTFPYQSYVSGKVSKNGFEATTQAKK